MAHFRHRHLACLLSFPLLLVSITNAQDAATGPTLRPAGVSQDLNPQSAQSEFLLGYQYDQQGKYQEAFEAYRRSAGQGYTLAQSALGSMYQMGRGVPRNFRRALRLYRPAADQGDPVAQSNLGLMYALGQGVRADTTEALNLFQESAEKGWAPGQANLAYLYATASPRELQRAYMWCVLALAGGQKGCKTTLGQVGTQLTAQGVQKAKEEAFLWYKARVADRTCSAELQNGSLATRVGNIYAAGSGVNRDDEEAAKWYRLAANLENATGQALLGEMYHLGRGLPKDDTQAFSWFEKSAQKGDASGERDLGFAYLQGVGTTKDSQKSLEWLHKAVAQGDHAAENLLAYCYQNGIGVQADQQEAAHLYQRAAEGGSVTALNNAAWMYATSQDSSLRDPDRALAYALAAVEATKEADPHMLDTLAEAYYARGDYAHAVDTEEKAVSLEPDDPAFKERLTKYMQAKTAPSNSN